MFIFNTIMYGMVMVALVNTQSPIIKQIKRFSLRSSSAPPLRVGTYLTQHGNPQINKACYEKYLCVIKAGMGLGNLLIY